MGRARALNFGLERCARRTSPYWTPTTSRFPIDFDRQVAYLDANADVALVGSRYRPFIDKDGNPTGEDIFPLRVLRNRRTS